MSSEVKIEKQKVIEKQTIHYKGTITAHKSHWIQKAIHIRQTHEDVSNRHFKTTLSVFVPKLTPKYRRPVVMLHMINGNGKTLCKFKNPIETAEFLEEIAMKIRSNHFLETWEAIEDISEDLIVGNLISDKNLMDIQEWKEYVIENPDLEIEA